jgi:hypothetical protein
VYLQRILAPNIVDSDKESFATTIHLGTEETVEGLGTVFEQDGGEDSAGTELPRGHLSETVVAVLRTNLPARVQSTRRSFEEHILRTKSYEWLSLCFGTRRK